MAAPVVEASVLAVADLAHLPVLALARVVARRVHRVQLRPALRLLLLARAAPPVRALLPVAAVLAVLAHLVVEAAAQEERLLLLLSHRSF